MKTLSPEVVADLVALFEQKGWREAAQLLKDAGNGHVVPKPPKDARDDLSEPLDEFSEPPEFFYKKV